MWIYLIQLEKKVLENGSQLSDASIKAPTKNPLKWIFEGIHQDSRAFGVLWIVMDRRYIFRSSHVGADSWLSLQPYS